MNIDELAGRLAGATVIGLGTSTRFSRNVFGIAADLSRTLIEQHGFRVLALQDSADVAARLDDHVRTGTGTAESAMDTAWRPWRHQEMVVALDWIRAFDIDHPDDPVRIIGVKPVQAKPADYDAVLAAAGEHAPDLLPGVRAHFDVIRTAHTLDEHVQKARGTHPGRPFAEHAREAAKLIESVPGIPLERLRLIVEFHEHSVAGRDNYGSEAELWAAPMLTGDRTLYWDAIPHTAATPVTLGAMPERGPQPTEGSVLRRHFGSGYASVAIGFHHGDLGLVDVPAPPPDLLDATLDGVRWATEHTPARLRVIGGVYDPAHDDRGYLAVDDLAAAFDLLIQIDEARPVHWL